MAGIGAYGGAIWTGWAVPTGIMGSAPGATAHVVDPAGAWTHPNDGAGATDVGTPCWTHPVVVASVGRAHASGGTAAGSGAPGFGCDPFGPPLVDSVDMAFSW
jgi:hypothetical protein